MNKITAIIPTYNPVKSWMQETLDSCVGVDEIIVCNDGTPNFNERQYKFPVGIQGRYIHNPDNMGCFRAINRLCGEVEDGFITIQADDDYYDKENLPKIIEQARLSDADVIYFPCMYFGKYNGLFGARDKVDYRSLLQGNYVYGSSFFKKELWDFLQGFQLQVSADWDFWVRAIKSGAKFEYCSLTGAHFRVTGRSMFEKSLVTIGRDAINKIVYDNSVKWNKRYEKTRKYL